MLSIAKARALSGQSAALQFSFCSPPALFAAPRKSIPVDRDAFYVSSLEQRDDPELRDL
jgi:hypothetical protein